MSVKEWLDRIFSCNIKKKFAVFYSQFFALWQYFFVSQVVRISAFPLCNFFFKYKKKCGRHNRFIDVKKMFIIRILYELFVALENKRKSQLTGTAMETMRPKAPKVKEEMNREYYQNVSNTRFKWR